MDRAAGFEFEIVWMRMRGVRMRGVRLGGYALRWLGVQIVFAAGYLLRAAESYT